MGCPQFHKYELGACTGSLVSLEEYSEQLKDMVTFFLGCGFSPEEALEKAGLPRRDPAGHGHVGAYKVGTPSTGQRDLRKMWTTLCFPAAGRTRHRRLETLRSQAPLSHL